MTTMPDVITAPQAERHNRRRKGYPLPGSYWDRVQRGPRNPLLRNALDRLNKALDSRNLVFEVGGHMEQVFQALIDRSRALLDAKKCAGESWADDDFNCRKVGRPNHR
jgi:hypothetical protein